MKSEITQTLVLLTAYPEAVAPAEQFLVNRNWTIFRTTDEKEALRALVDRRPSYFMISVQHSNRRVRGLHHLLKQTYPDLCVIYFAEQNHIDSYRALSQVDHPYRLQAPVTGPAVERAVQKHLNSLREIQQDQAMYERALKITFGDEPLKEEVASPLENAVRSLSGDKSVVKERIHGKTQHLICTPVQSGKDTGYLLTIAAGDVFVEEKFVRGLRSRLSRYIREDEDHVFEGESFPLQVEKVEFSSWAEKEGQFFQRTVHEGQEVALGFFPAELPRELEFVDSDHRMAKVHLEDLEADQVVEFGLYVYLPSNKKHILYTPKGAKFLSEQKERLSQGGLVEFHIRREEISEYKKYRVRNHLNRLISRHENRSIAA